MSGDRPVGMISLAFNERVKTRHVANIYGFYVSPAARGRGIGMSVLKAAVSLARRNKGIVKVRPSVNPRFRAASSLYEEAGSGVTGAARRELKVGAGSTTC
ncbi:MAG: GNAT family N-acetyltransferase [Nitrososphaerota archaeon]|nr:GNAT family N-acetyltransferase [Nitrososphaerota archaeon]